MGLVIPTITSYSSSSVVTLTKYPHLKGLKLADDFQNQSEIHMLLGVNAYGAILLGEIKRRESDEPIAQNTVFGWVVYGSCQSMNQLSSLVVHHVQVEDDTHVLIKRFRELEGVSDKRVKSPNEDFCESHFQTTNTQISDGRYVVKVLFVEGKLSKLGHSQQIAESCFLRNEKRFHTKPDVWKLYREFM